MKIISHASRHPSNNKRSLFEPCTHALVHLIHSATHLVSLVLAHHQSQLLFRLLRCLSQACTHSGFCSSKNALPRFHPVEHIQQLLCPFSKVSPENSNQSLALSITVFSTLTLSTPQSQLRCQIRNSLSESEEALTVNRALLPLPLLLLILLLLLLLLLPLL